MRNRRGSAMVEYAALIAVAVAALISMAVYLKRSVNSKYKEVGDALGQGRQYEPGVTRDQNGLLVN